MKKKIILAATISTISIVSILVWQHDHPSEFDASKYTDISQQQECLNAYYKKYPEAKPHSGVITGPPPCPGILQ